MAGSEGPDSTIASHATLRSRMRSRVERILSGVGYTGVLLLLTISFIVINLSDTAFMYFITIFLQWLTLIVALRASYASRRTIIVAAILFIIGVGVNIISANQTFGFIWLLGVILLGVTAFSIVQHLVRSTLINGQTILGALCTYIIIGMFFAYLDAFVGTFVMFFTTSRNSSIQQYLYFSYITLATVGYGDLIPHGNIPRMLSVMEALLGQLYLVAFVALIVSNYGRIRTPKSK